MWIDISHVGEELHLNCRLRGFFLPDTGRAGMVGWHGGWRDWQEPTHAPGMNWVGKRLRTEIAGKKGPMISKTPETQGFCTSHMCIYYLCSFHVHVYTSLSHKKIWGTSKHIQIRNTWVKTRTRKRALCLLSYWTLMTTPLHTWCYLLPIAEKMGTLRFNVWVGKIPWRRAWQPIPVFLPGESHGQRSLEGCNDPRGHEESDTTVVT